jgi:hypothetical protein
MPPDSIRGGGFQPPLLDDGGWKSPLRGHPIARRRQWVR